MYLQKKIVPLCAAATSLVFIALLFQQKLQALSLGFSRSDEGDEMLSETRLSSRPARNANRQSFVRLSDANEGISSGFHPGSFKSQVSNYSRVMVVPRMKDEDITWITDELPDLNTSVYVANDASAPLHPPRNKGHEVMIYLTYIIDHYDNLPDIVLFMHSHRWTHHNNEFLGHDAVEMIYRLRSWHVIRKGYMNMRCHWSPGCPEWLHPVSKQELLGKQEETMLSKCWSELFPLEPIPAFLAQPCCAQFALSKERLLAIPLSRFVFYRDWMLRTPLSDYISGRIWEYTWQYVFTSQSADCPTEYSCYCDGFGVCFGGEAPYQAFLELRDAKIKYEVELEQWRSEGKIFEEAAQTEKVTWRQAPDRARYTFLNERIKALSKEMNARKQKAVERGHVSGFRAEGAEGQ